eukprot:TRINITY_DN11601_c0_g1_i1.p1 TRINITY_DN11601_c0_g1~~TRINITY_DN11601_c0_g1_i1.p1  ORF type:complete len:798 (-),score=195.03 TRINITY_DN11601_c0_g1_i1:171-2504(-)
MIAAAFLVITAFLVPSAQGITFFVSSSTGSDSNDGLSASSPWKTLQFVQTKLSVLRPGDTILFCRGDTFSGSLVVPSSGNSGNRVTFGAYGAGNLSRPVISGTLPLSGAWTRYSGQIWKIDVPSAAGSPVPSINALYWNGQRQDLARFPNRNDANPPAMFLRATTVGYPRTVYAMDGLAGKPTGYFVGAFARARASNWLYQTSRVSNYVASGLDSGIFTLDSDLYSAWPQAGWGFYFDNVFAELDAAGEYFYDGTTLYWQPPAGASPNTDVVEISVQNYGFTKTDYSQWVTIRELHFRGQGQAGVRLGNFSGVQGVVIDNCEFSLQELFAIWGPGNVVNCAFTNNFIHDVGGQAIRLSGGYTSNITGNLIRNVGLVDGQGTPIGDRLAYNAVFTTPVRGYVVQYNTIDSIGYVGISVNGEANLIDSNVISNTMLTQNDGGGIYLGGLASHDTTMSNNTIVNVVGNTVSCPPGQINGATGIYMDSGAWRMTIHNNRVSNVGGNALSLIWGNGHTITNNVLQDVGNGVASIVDDNGGGVVTGFTFANNQFISMKSNTLLLEVPSTSKWGSLSGNTYCSLNPYPFKLVGFKTKYINYNTFQQMYGESPRPVICKEAVWGDGSISEGGSGPAGLSKGAIIAIIVLVFLVIIAVAVTVVCYRTRRFRRKPAVPPAHYWHTDLPDWDLPPSSPSPLPAVPPPLPPRQPSYAPYSPYSPQPAQPASALYATPPVQSHATDRGYGVGFGAHFGAPASSQAPPLPPRPWQQQPPPLPPRPWESNMP